MREFIDGRKAKAVVAFKASDVISAVSTQFNSRFLEAGFKTGTVTMEVDGFDGTVTFTQYEGDGE